MRHVLILLSLYTVFNLFLSLPAHSVTTEEIDMENRLLEAELRLARKPKIYFIFDLKNRVISLKSKGIMFKELRIEDKKIWGYPVEIEPIILLKKTALFPPKREKIKPKKSEKDKHSSKFEIKALELEDMPSNYTLVFEKDVIISVRAESEGLAGEVLEILTQIRWYIATPIIGLWNFIRNKPYTAIYITLGKEDARSLYWHLPEGTENIVYNPS